MLAGFQAMQRMLRADRLPTALLVTNDFVAVGVMEKLSMAGIGIPEQISIIGFDDLGVKTSHPLTTVRVDLPHVGRLAAGTLARIIQQQSVEVEHTVVPVELVVRATTAPALAAAAVPMP
jgi:DNA-binding LacI/PurR family transcriptional regulator